jgi:hypothetical protein
MPSARSSWSADRAKTDIPSTPGTGLGSETSWDSAAFLENRDIIKSRRADSNRLPLLQLRVINRGLPRVAIPAYLSDFLFSGLHCVAPYCAPGGIRVVSKGQGYRAFLALENRGFAESRIPTSEKTYLQRKFTQKAYCPGPIGPGEAMWERTCGRYYESSFPKVR